MTTEPTQFMCQNCSTLYTQDQLDPLEDVLERVAPGETMPWGQCPDSGCGAVCYPPEPAPTPEPDAIKCPSCGEGELQCVRDASSTRMVIGAHVETYPYGKDGKTFSSTVCDLSKLEDVNTYDDFRICCNACDEEFSEQEVLDAINES